MGRARPVNPPLKMWYLRPGTLIEQGGAYRRITGRAVAVEFHPLPRRYVTLILGRSREER